MIVVVVVCRHSEFKVLSGLYSPLVKILVLKQIKKLSLFFEKNGDWDNVFWITSANASLRFLIIWFFIGVWHVEWVNALATHLILEKYREWFMSQYSSNQFKPNEAWLILYFPLQGQSIYFLLDVASEYIFGNILTSGEIPSESEVVSLMKKAFSAKRAWPKKIFLSRENPAKEFFGKCATKNNIQAETEPLTDLMRITKMIQKLLAGC